MSNELAKTENNPAALIALAIEQKAPMESLSKLMDLQERYEKNEARKAYHVAMAAFKADPPTIVKSREVSFGNTKYKHADLAEISTLISEALSKHGLSAAWRIEQGEKAVTVTCEITHILGHSESTPMTAPPDTSGSKNSIQSIASTVTYLQRYTLLSITGLAASDTDDDGTTSEGEAELITAGQAGLLTSLAKEVGADTKKFCEHLKIDNLEALRVDEYQKAVSLLEAKRVKANAK